MYKIIRKVTPVLLLVTVFFAAFTVPAYAQSSSNLNDGLDICDIIGPLCDALNINVGASDASIQETAFSFVRDRASLIISVIFVAIILIAVYVIISAGVKYIQSQGEEGKIAESKKAIQSVFVGIAILFVGIVGIVLVLAFFGGTGLLSPAGGEGDEGCTFNETTGIECP